MIVFTGACQEFHGVLAIDSGEVFQEQLLGNTGCHVIEQCLGNDARVTKNQCPTEDLRVGMNGAVIQNHRGEKVV